MSVVSAMLPSNVETPVIVASSAATDPTRRRITGTPRVRRGWRPWAWRRRSSSPVHRDADGLLWVYAEDPAGLPSRDRAYGWVPIPSSGGAQPVLRGFRRPGEQAKFLVETIAALHNLGRDYADIALFTRSSKLWPRARMSALWAPSVKPRTPSRSTPPRRSPSRRTSSRSDLWGSWESVTHRG